MKCPVYTTVCMFTSGMVIHYLGQGSHSPAPRQHTVLKGNVVFDLQDFDLHTISQEHNPGIKCDLPVLAHLFATLQTLPV